MPFYIDFVWENGIHELPRPNNHRRCYFNTDSFKLYRPYLWHAFIICSSHFISDYFLIDMDALFFIWSIRVVVALWNLFKNPTYKDIKNINFFYNKVH